MSTAPGLSFANITLLLDIPQLPAIFAANCFHNYRTLLNEFNTVYYPSDDVIYPFNRVNKQDRHYNKMGRLRKYNNDGLYYPYGKPY